MTNGEPRRPDEAVSRSAIQVSIRLGVLALLIILCLRIVAPFINLLLWAVIVAVALFPMQQRLCRLLGGSERLAAAVIVLIALATLLIPVSLMADSGITSVRALGGELRSGELSIPPPSEKVAEWPVVGESLYGVWSDLAEDLEQTINQFRPQLVGAGEWLLKGIGRTAGGVFVFTASLILSGFFLVSARSGYDWTCRLMSELAGERGASLTDLCVQTIRSVAKGVLGVAVTQTLLAGLGLVVMGVPATGLILAIILLFAVMQLPTLIVVGPLVFWVYSVAEPLPATLFAAWMILVSISDNVLKPILLGRGVKVPALVILVGAVGGAVYSGLIGLFLGAVVLSVGYELMLAWLDPESVDEKLAKIAE